VRPFASPCPVMSGAWLLGAAALPLLAARILPACISDGQRRCTQTSAARDNDARLDALVRAVAGQPLPCMLVDLAAFDENIAWFAGIARAAGRTIRLASKSLRVPALIRRCLERHSDVFRGLMCFSVPEAVWLAEQVGEHDILVAYPTVQPSDLALAWTSAASSRHNPPLRLTLMIDSPTHVLALASFWQQRLDELSREDADKVLPLRVCIDMDMSYRPVHGVHLGAHRSPCRSLDNVRELVACIRKFPRSLQLVGLMGYEAQIAGVPDASPFSPLLNWAVRGVKVRSAVVVQLVARMSDRDTHRPCPARRQSRWPMSCSIGLKL
jgi:D-serine deaminase-like pyridoxal phosphate-dependent protein